MIERLREYQDSALSTMGRARALLDAAQPDVMALAQCRWQLARVLRAYQIHKHQCVFDPIIARDAQPERVALARRLKTNCVAMGDRFRDHLLRWSATSVADEWTDYRPAAISIIAALGAHIDREREGITALQASETAPPSIHARTAAAAPAPRLRY